MSLVCLLRVVIMCTVNHHNNKVCCPEISEQKQELKRDEKVHEIRSKLKSGRYDVAAHLETAIDRLLEKILASKN